MKPPTPEEYALLKKDDKLINRKYRKEHPLEWIEHIARLPYIKSLRRRRQTEINRKFTLDPQVFKAMLEDYEKAHPRIAKTDLYFKI